MPGIDKRVPFFEETSQSRDTTSWWEHLKSKVLHLGLEVKGLVSDRARALIKLGKPGYLNVSSMPDLFHFAQDMGKAVGCRIELKKSQLQKKWRDCTYEQQQAELETELNQVSQYQRDYREQIEQVNKTVHPFNAQDEWQQKEEVEKGLLQCLTKIGNIAKALRIDIALPKVSKILNQIPDIAQGVQAWIESTSKEIKEWILLHTIPISHQQ